MGLFDSRPAPRLDWGFLSKPAERATITPQVEPRAPETVTKWEDGRPTLVQLPQTIAPDVLTALNATTAGTAQSPPHGILESVTPVSLNGTAIPRGRMYAQLVLRVRGTSAIIACLWRGYLVTEGGSTATAAGPSSVPGTFVYPGLELVTIVTQTGQGAANTRVGFVCQVNPSEATSDASGYIHTEEPGSGDGEVVIVTIADPAAGSSPNQQTIGAKESVRLNQVRMTMVPSGAAADRMPRVLVLTAASVELAVFPTESVGASTSAFFSWMRGQQVTKASSTSTNNNWRMGSLYDGKLTATMIWKINVVGIQAADQCSLTAAVLEVWAVP